MKHLLMTLALVAAVLAVPVQAGEKTCKECCKDKTCQECCKGKCSECCKK